MVRRPALLSALERALARSRVVVLTGPRQCGKTTLAREMLEAESANYFDLEDPASLARLDEPMTALRPLEGLVVIDEVQRRPDLFPVLRVLADRGDLPARVSVVDTIRSPSPDMKKSSRPLWAHPRASDRSRSFRGLPGLLAELRGRSASIYEEVRSAVSRWRDFATEAAVGEGQAQGIQEALRLELPAG